MSSDKFENMMEDHLIKKAETLFAKRPILPNLSSPLFIKKMEFSSNNHNEEVEEEPLLTEESKYMSHFSPLLKAKNSNVEDLNPKEKNEFSSKALKFRD